MKDLLKALGCGAAVTLVAWFLKIPSEVTAGVTVTYVVLVYYQLRAMQDQNATFRNQRRASLSLNHTVRRDVPEIGGSGQQIAVGTYVTGTLQNGGPSMALHCQPVVSAFATWESATSVWRPHPSWIGLELLWALDELNIGIGTPTHERSLTPNRPYLFDLLSVSSIRPDVLQLRSIMSPTSQPTEFKPGEYCFEVTAYSENAETAKAWFKVDFDQSSIEVAVLPACPWVST